MYNENSADSSYPYLLYPQLEVVPTSTEKQARLEIFRAVATSHHRDPLHIVVKLSAHLLRFLEMPFVGSNLYYHKGTPYVSWRALQSKLGKSRGLEQFARHFGGEGLIVDSSGSVPTVKASKPT
ncbi:hypothetical protein P3T76_014923 [Phytophthora citrophthora]|uniref:Uncharacterized protein n=1 Tax=Phytophthora citrophthora TaxID=4793 RepID=A0AAD9LAP1_9STRA|nr:hypothetical protein P3T76_014923 [Phytophthora citrophthora]